MSDQSSPVDNEKKLEWQAQKIAELDDECQRLRSQIGSASVKNDDAQAASMTGGDEGYLIWSNEHAQWWRAARMGYTNLLQEAGVYPKAEAIKICRNAIPGTAARLGMLPEIPVRKADLKLILRDAPEE